jgi:chemotaxis protein CheC
LTDLAKMMLNEPQLASLQSSLHQGSAQASKALAKWIGKPTVIEIDSLEQLPLEDATGTLADSDQPVCYCSMALQGFFTGEMILVFDDASGLALADLLLDQPRGTAQSWTELATSAALETTNIICCAYLNSLSECFSGPKSSTELVPQPPRFNREFAESLMQFALMSQAMEFDDVILAKTRFTIDGARVNWTLLFVPDAETMLRLSQLLDTGDPA